MGAVDSRRDLPRAGRRRRPLRAVTIHEEVAQLDLRDEVVSLGRPGQALGGSARVELAAGGSARLRSGVDPGRLGCHDATVAAVVEPGDATVRMGGSVADTRLRQTATVGGTRHRLDQSTVLPASVQVDVVTDQEQATR